MRGKRVSIRLKVVLAIFTLTLFVIPAWAGTRSFKILHNFNSHQGSHPEGVILRADGNLYGVTVFGGGNSGIGTVFELSPAVGGRWLETKMHIFNGVNGQWPNQGLLFDSAGNLYGTMQVGPDGGTGMVYELSPLAVGGWRETVIHDLSFGEGLYPESPLIRDGAGNLYSTAWGGGAYGLGTVFELSPIPGGGWTETTIHSFDGADGAVNKSGLIFDASGNLYGTTVCGGTSAASAVRETAQSAGIFPDCGGAAGAGTVWQLTRQSDGSWTETTLYNFTGGSNGANPVQPGGLIFDSAGNLYGTTLNGGVYGRGTVFELSPGTGGVWTETVLHSFNGPHGSYPYASLVLDAAGNLYGEAQSGGEGNAGVVFELMPTGGGSWKYRLLHSFSGPDGSTPEYGLTFDDAGKLYGTTNAGGTYGNGTVFQIIP